MSLKRAIVLNQRRYKWRRVLNRLRLNIFDYEDQGKLAKAEAIMDKIARRLRGAS